MRPSASSWPWKPGTTRGRGQRVDTSLLEGQMAMMSYHLTRYFATGTVPGPSGSGSDVSVPYQAFQAADEWMVIAVFNDRMWRDFAHAIGQPDWAADLRFENANARARHRALLLGMISGVLSQHPVRYWEKAARGGGGAVLAGQHGRPDRRRGAGGGARDGGGDRCPADRADEDGRAAAEAQRDAGMHQPSAAAAGRA
ncbi:MAG: CoA transferase [Acetobacteraceae bacterium]